MEDPYKILNITINSSQRNIDTSFKIKIKPFLNRQLNEQERVLVRQYKDAYKILGDYQCRRSYDNQVDGLVPSKKFSELRSKKIKTKKIEKQFNYENNGVNYTSALMRPFQNNFGLPGIDLDLENKFRMSENTFKRTLREEREGLPNSVDYHMTSFNKNVRQNKDGFALNPHDVKKQKNMYK
jgi:DnaJ-class molecular chaperone